MSSLMGGEKHSIDSKGRVKIPARILRQLENEGEETFVLTRGQDGCIFAYPANEWKEVERKIRSLNQFEEKNRYFVRHFLMFSEEITLDPQKRLILPKKLADYAQINEEITIVGVIDRIEFWNPQRFDEYLAKYDADYDKISEEVMTR